MDRWFESCIETYLATARSIARDEDEEERLIGLVTNHRGRGQVFDRNAMTFRDAYAIIRGDYV